MQANVGGHGDCEVLAANRSYVYEGKIRQNFDSSCSESTIRRTSMNACHAALHNRDRVTAGSRNWDPRMAVVAIARSILFSSLDLSLESLPPVF